MGERLLVVSDHVGSRWITLVTCRAVVGFRWTLYLTSSEVDPLALEHMYPGGVASGWIEDHYEPRTVAVAFAHVVRLYEATSRAWDTDIDASIVREVPHG